METMHAGNQILMMAQYIATTVPLDTTMTSTKILTNYAARKEAAEDLGK
jgi:hypothetical protein